MATGLRLGSSEFILSDQFSETEYSPNLIFIKQSGTTLSRSHHNAYAICWVSPVRKFFWRPLGMRLRSHDPLVKLVIGYIADGSQDWNLTILRAAKHETELGDHDFCLSRSHYTDTDPTSRERAATAGIEPGTSSLGVGRSTDGATAPPWNSLQ